MKKWLITCDTSWCGTETSYTAIADTELELVDVAEELAYENFNDLGGGFESVLEELFPDEEEYTEEMENEAMDKEHEFYSVVISEWNLPEEEWSWYDCVYDGRNIELDKAEEDYNELDNLSRT